MKKQGKKWMLVVIALLALVTVALPLVGCKNDSVSEPVKYTVKFSKEENTEFTGIVPADLTVVSGTKLTAEQLKDLDDTTSYTFDGWHDGETKAEAGYEVKKNVTLTAKWTKKDTVAPVTFDPEAGGVDAGTMVKLTTATEGATIEYKLTGDTEFKTYEASTEIIINGEETITVQATKAGMLPSEETTASYHIHSYDWKEQTPSTDTEPGTLAGECTVCNLSTTKDIPVGFAYVKGGTIEGAALPWNPTEDYEKGVFIAGRTVTLSDFFIGKYEVTQAEWEAVMTGNNNGISAEPSHFKGVDRQPADGEEQTQRPVESVSWYDAVVYCNKRSIKEGLTPCYKKGSDTNPDNWRAVPTSSDNDSWKDAITCNFTANGYRLPTEAEWEYAARGGKPNAAEWKYQYAGTSEDTQLEYYAWYDGYSSSKTHEVGKKTENSLGLYDMSGNVWEWCWDWYADAPTAGDGEESPVTDPTGPETEPTSGFGRVHRGGSWFDRAVYFSVSNRNYDNPNDRNNYVGFRVVRGL